MPACVFKPIFGNCATSKYALFCVRYPEPRELLSLPGQPVTKRPICVDVTLNTNQLDDPAKESFFNACLKNVASFPGKYYVTITFFVTVTLREVYLLRTLAMLIDLVLIGCCRQQYIPVPVQFTYESQPISAICRRMMRVSHVGDCT